MNKDHYILKKLDLSNFKGSASKMQVKFNGLFVWLIGLNGAGKSMIGNAVQFLFEGPTFFNAKYRRRMITDDNDKTSVSAVFENVENGREITATRTLTAKGNGQITVKTNFDEEKTKEEFLSMINMIYLRPQKLCQRTPQELAKFFNVDTSKYDDKIKAQKEFAKTPRAEIKRLKALIETAGELEKVEEVDTKEISEKIKAIQAENEKKKESFINLRSINFNHIFNKHSTSNYDKDTYIRMKQEMIDYVDSFMYGGDLVSTSTLELRLEDSAEINKKAAKYETLQSNKKELKKQEKLLKEKKDKFIEIQEEKIEYIKSQKLPKNLSVDEDGGLTVTAFDQENAYLDEHFFSTGQILTISIQLCVAKIMRAKARKEDIIPLVVIDNANDLDENHIAKIKSYQEKFGIQFILALPKKEELDGETCIVLEEKEIKKYTGSEE